MIHVSNKQTNQRARKMSAVNNSHRGRPVPHGLAEKEQKLRGKTIKTAHTPTIL
jgi:hypothetical protein